MTTTNEGPAMMAGPTQASAEAETRSSLKDDPTVPHRCLAVDRLADMEAAVRRSLEYHQAKAQKMARYRRAIVQCLHDHHHLSYTDIARRLPGVTASRAQQIAKGKT